MHSGGHGSIPREQYFYLSYVHLPGASIDYWVLRFFNDLHAEVRRIAGAAGDTDLGFVNRRPPNPARDSVATRALDLTRILVPLYTPDYLSGQSTSAELFLFQQRMANPATEMSIEHIQAVIWSPVVPSPDYPNLERAVELGSDCPEYLQLGLSAMCRLKLYKPAYRVLVERLAQRIVGIAEGSGVELGAKAAIDSPGRVSREADFIIAVVAPTDSRLPAQREPRCYGPRSHMWQPFRSAHDDTIAEFTAGVARSLRLPTQVVDFDAGDTTLETSPGLILVDPWILIHDDGRALLNAVYATLRQWVSLVVVVDRNDPQYAYQGSELADQVFRMKTKTQSGLLVRDAQEFEQKIGKLIERMRRKYLSERPAPKGSGTQRPSLRNPGTPSPPPTEEDQ